MTSSLATDPSRHLQGTRVVHVAWFGGYAPAPAAVRVGVDVTAVNRTSATAAESPQLPGLQGGARARKLLE